MLARSSQLSLASDSYSNMSNLVRYADSSITTGKWSETRFPLNISNFARAVFGNALFNSAYSRIIVHSIISTLVLHPSITEHVTGRSASKVDE